MEAVSECPTLPLTLIVKEMTLQRKVVVAAEVAAVVVEVVVLVAALEVEVITEEVSDLKDHLIDQEEVAENLEIWAAVALAAITAVAEQMTPTIMPAWA